MLVLNVKKSIKHYYRDSWFRTSSYFLLRIFSRSITLRYHIMVTIPWHFQPRHIINHHQIIENQLTYRLSVAPWLSVFSAVFRCAANKYDDGEREPFEIPGLPSFFQLFIDSALLMSARSFNDPTLVLSTWSSTAK